MIGIDKVMDFGSAVLDKIIPDAAERQQAKMKLAEMQQTGELDGLKTRLSAILAEAQSNDKWTSRARPSFMYVFYILILFSLPIGIPSTYDPLLAKGITEGTKAWLSALPEGLWYTFGVGYTGYSAFRSYDKKKLLEKNNS